MLFSRFAPAIAFGPIMQLAAAVALESTTAALAQTQATQPSPLCGFNTDVQCKATKTDGGGWWGSANIAGSMSSGHDPRKDLSPGGSLGSAFLCSTAGDPWKWDVTNVKGQTLHVLGRKGINSYYYICEAHFAENGRMCDCKV